MVAHTTNRDAVGGVPYMGLIATDGEMPGRPFNQWDARVYVPDFSCFFVCFVVQIIPAIPLHRWGRCTLYSSDVSKIPIDERGIRDKALPDLLRTPSTSTSFLSRCAAQAFL